jgi:hypothetical protein
LYEFDHEMTTAIVTKISLIRPFLLLL